MGGERFSVQDKSIVITDATGAQGSVAVERWPRTGCG